MNTLMNLMNDECGFIVSAELVLIATLGVLAMVVGLSEVAFNVNSELEDVASAFGSMNQSFRVNGMGGHGGKNSGTSHGDHSDFCDGQGITPTSPTGEQ